VLYFNSTDGTTTAREATSIEDVGPAYLRRPRRQYCVRLFRDSGTAERGIVERSCHFSYVWNGATTRSRWRPVIIATCRELSRLRYQVIGVVIDTTRQCKHPEATWSRRSNDGKRRSAGVTTQSTQRSGVWFDADRREPRRSQIDDWLASIFFILSRVVCSASH
jgi:hypothetical protein